MGFIKKVTERGEYYSLVKRDRKEHYSWKKDWTPEMLNEHKHNNSPESYFDYEDSTFMKEVHYEMKENFATVPFGCYDYLPVTPYSSMPAHLAPKITRQGETYIPASNLTDLRNDINKFLVSRDIYKEFGSLYRRGYLIHGPPGNGKTTLIRQLSLEFPNYYTIWSRHVPESDFCDALNGLPGIKFFILEEISPEDAQFRPSDLLDFLDGENSLKNCIVIATTNFPEKLKANLANRPSRFDVVLEVGNPTLEQAKDFLSKFLKIDIDVTWEERLSFAQLKEVALLHKLHGITLHDAVQRMITHKEVFNRGFVEVKKFGF